MRIERLEQDYERVIGKRAACNHKRYPPKWMKIEKREELALPVKEIRHEPDFNRKAAVADSEKSGTGIRGQGSRNVPAANGNGRGTESCEMGIAEIERYVHGCEKLVHELAGLVGQNQGESVKPPEAPRRTRMR